MVTYDYGYDYYYDSLPLMDLSYPSLKHSKEIKDSISQFLNGPWNIMFLNKMTAIIQNFFFPIHRMEVNSICPPQRKEH